MLDHASSTQNPFVRSLPIFSAIQLLDRPHLKGCKGRQDCTSSLDRLRLIFPLLSPASSANFLSRSHALAVARNM